MYNYLLFFASIIYSVLRRVLTKPPLWETERRIKLAATTKGSILIFHLFEARFATHVTRVHLRLRFQHFSQSVSYG